MLYLLIACGRPSLPPPELASPQVPARRTYAEARAKLATTRAQLGADLQANPKARDRILGEARSALLRTISDDLFPAWYGTRWDFYGMSTEPGEGRIACGYFVSTVLEHADLKVERTVLAQQASSHIIETLVPKKTMRWWYAGQRDKMLDVVRAGGDGLWVVGLDNHVGFLLHEGARLDFCHSSYVGEARVVCEPATSSVGLGSRVYVIGRLFGDELVEAWLAGEAIETVHTQGH